VIFCWTIACWSIKIQTLKGNINTSDIVAGDAIMSCPICHSTKNIICLAGGIVIAQTQQMPFYCLTCKQNFLAIKKKRLETGSQNLSFEVIAVDQKFLSPKLVGYKPNSLKRLGVKWKER